jgi:hypothetical protein
MTTSVVDREIQKTVGAHNQRLARCRYAQWMQLYEASSSMGCICRTVHHTYVVSATTQLHVMSFREHAACMVSMLCTDTGAAGAGPDTSPLLLLLVCMPSTAHNCCCCCWCGCSQQSSTQKPRLVLADADAETTAATAAHHHV